MRLKQVVTKITVNYSAEALGEGEALAEALALGEAEGLLDALTEAEGEATFGLADAEADGLGSRAGLGATDGTTTTSGDGVGCGFEVTLSRSQTK